MPQNASQGHHKNGGTTEKDSSNKKIAPILALFKFSSIGDKFLTLFGILCAIIGGLCIPAYQIFNGQFANSFICYEKYKTRFSALNNTLNDTEVPTFCLDMDKEKIHSNIRMGVIAIGIMCVVRMVSGYIMMTFFTIAAENQVFRIRCLFLKSFLRQNVEWFDQQSAGDFACRSVEDLQRYKDGISYSLGLMITYLATFFGAVILSLVSGWKLALVTLSFLPLIILNETITAKLQSTWLELAINMNVKAGNVAEEIFSLIRTVFAYSGESKEIDRYENVLKASKRMGIKSGFIRGIGMGLGQFIVFAYYGLALWYGIKLIIESSHSAHPEYTPGKINTVILVLMVGSVYLSQATGNIEAFQNARMAIVYPYAVIARKSPIDSGATDGLKPNNIAGNITFTDVYFNYPSRADVKILQGFDLQIKSGDTVAFVGKSGCGKSTAVQLLQRFYDPVKGAVKMDGIDLKEMNVGFLRDHIGVVGQEPVLFEASILDNIRFGNEKSTLEDIIKACKQANAHDFIKQLPQRYNTMVGENGTQLSGGQKQRIAIARALVRNPRILILDEATSALDRESERSVQQALDKASKGRTTVIVAHRLSTISNADKIVVITKGAVSEIGSHKELMQLEGAYFDLVMHQVDAANSCQDNSIEDSYNEDNSSYNSFRSSGRGVSSLKRHGRHGSETMMKLERKISEREMNDNKKKSTPSVWKLLKANSPEWVILLFGSIGTLVNGATPAAYAMFYSSIFGAIARLDANSLTRHAAMFAIIFLVIAAVSGVGKFFQTSFFTISGERLTMRLRKKTLTAMLRQEVAWFDEPENSAGALSSRLSNDTAAVQWAAKSFADAFLQSIFAMLVSVILAIVYHWRLGLVLTCLFAVGLIGITLNAKLMDNVTKTSRIKFQYANKVAMEAILNLRTVASLHIEDAVYKSYVSRIEGPFKKAKRISHFIGLTFGFSQAVLYLGVVVIFHYGSTLLFNNEVAFTTIIMVNQLYISGLFRVGEMVMFSAYVKKALVASAFIFQIWERKSKIDSFDKEGIHLDTQICNSNQDGEKNITIKFNNIIFKYPTRKEANILQRLLLEIPAGKNTALVGASGCGKSTCIQLLQRFYDPEQGEVLVNGNDLRKLNIRSLRSCIGIVSQEPLLFDRSILENIKYGDNSRDISMCAVIEAARKANIHDYISALPEGYETNVGRKGVQLSGGQKQRIAIARALIRNPRILLLDEATSALDVESEMIVQKTLEEAQKGRTCITIAHRLTTIKNADYIVVFHQGKVAERGTHNELLQLKGHYYKLYENHT